MRHLLALFALSLGSCVHAQSSGFKADLAGWELVTTIPGELAKICTVGADGVVAVTGQPVAFFATLEDHANYRLRVEWRWPGKTGNGGILLHIVSGPKDRAWPECFQVQLKHQAAGDMIPMAGATFAEKFSTPAGAPTPFLGHAALVSEKPAGEWNTAIVVCRGDTIEVTINGVVQNRVTGCSLQAGRVGFQLEGTPFELRNLSITPLD